MTMTKLVQKLAFYGIQNSLLCSQQPITGPRYKQHESSTYPDIHLFMIYIIKFSDYTEREQQTVNVGRSSHYIMWALSHYITGWTEDNHMQTNQQQSVLTLTTEPGTWHIRSRSNHSTVMYSLIPYRLRIHFTIIFLFLIQFSLWLPCLQGF
jgi:hypothetical protein